MFVIGDLAFTSEQVISYSRLLECCNSQAMSEKMYFYFGTGSLKRLLMTSVCVV